jgi:hypothetical protein
VLGFFWDGLQVEGASKKRRGGIGGGGGGGGGSLASSTRKDKGLSVDFKESQVRGAVNLGLCV